jgi:hypothetical protein
VADDDWRLMGQERYLQGASLESRRWYPSRPPDEGGPWDHDHCAFCSIHFNNHVLEDDPDTQVEGYATPDGQHWICRGCFSDFHERFGFIVVCDPPA